MVLIGGMQKTSLVDYPGNIATTIFLQGCNFECGFCHNPELLPLEAKNSIPEEEVISFLESRKNLIDGVCITGGEPTIQKDLVEFIGRIKEMSFLVKLDTNGSNPEIVKELIEKKLVDYIAMDVKTAFNNYKRFAEVDIDKIKESIKLIKKSGLDSEFRMTLHPSFQTKEEVLGVAKYLKGGKKFVLQQFYFNDKIVDPKYQNVKPFSEEEIKDMKKECDKFLNTQIRI